MAQPSNKTLYIIYGVMGVILLVLIVLIILSLIEKNQNEPDTIVKQNQLEEGIGLCNKAKSIFQNNNENACEALKHMEDGVIKMQAELNKHRDENNNLPAKLSGYDSKLAECLSFRKGLREQCFIAKERMVKKEIEK